jgi:hypothetical protein
MQQNTFLTLSTYFLWQNTNGCSFQIPMRRKVGHFRLGVENLYFLILINEMKDTPCIIVLMREKVTELQVNCVYLRGVYWDVHVLQMLTYTSS